MKIDETRLPQDGRFSTFLGRKIDFRVSSLPTRNGEKIVMRILDPLVGNIDLPDLGLAGHSLELVEKSIAKPFGQILVTGPTGSGKSTTLYSLLRRFNNDGINVITLEDPIEYFIDGVNQSQTHEEIGYTFASGLRTILRQDPDVIMVGEIRDRETAGLATNAALTGHIVLASLHTNDAVGVIPRLIDMGVEKYLIAPTLNLAIAQRLLRKLCNSCKVKSEPNAGEKHIIAEAINNIPEVYKAELPETVDYIYKPSEQGCKECGGKSYRGRIAIFEVLEMTDELEQLVLTDISESKIRAEAKRQNMIIMFQDGIIKVLQGVTSLEEYALALLGEENKEKFLQEKEADLAYTVGDKARFRINIYLTRGQYAIACRFIPYTIKTIEELKLPPIIKFFSKLSQGFVLVVGPNGHGKSTTMASLIDLINHERVEKIVTIEDPIEYMFISDKSVIDQREVGSDTNSFNAALRSTFRENVNVIMVGEMRDYETISTAVSAAETGHLVFASLHTNNAPQTIERIIDSFPPAQQPQIISQLANTISGVISQRLIPSTKGGLVPAVEIMIANSAVRNLIRENKTEQLGIVIETSEDAGMISLNKSLADLVRQGIVAREQAEFFSLNPKELKILLS